MTAVKTMTLTTTMSAPDAATTPAPAPDTAIAAGAISGISADPAAVLAPLLTQLERAGYTEHYASFPPLLPDPALWRTRLDNAPEDLRPLLQLFLHGDAIDRDRLARSLTDLPDARATIDALQAIGLLVSAPGGAVHTPGLVLLPVMGCWLLCQSPTGQAGPFYFGGDSLALAARLRPRAGDRVLDLCAGVGLQSLVCGRVASQVVAVELNPIAAEVGRLNIALNGALNGASNGGRDSAHGRIDMRCGDLYEASGPGPFDLVVANPPFLPIPDDAGECLEQSGGDDGLRVTWRILDGLPAHLADDGRAQLIGTCYSDEQTPQPAARLAAWCASAGMDALLTLTSRRPLAGAARAFASLVSTADDAERDRVAARFEEVWQAYRVTQLAAFYLYVRPGRGTLRVQDLSNGRANAFWYVA